MTGQDSEEPLDDEVDQIVHEAHKLDGYKQQIVEEMRKRGEDVDGARIIVAHRIGDPPDTTDVSDTAP